MIRAGSDDFLHKSIDPAQLITTLEARCKRARLINTALKRDGLYRIAKITPASWNTSDTIWRACSARMAS